MHSIEWLCCLIDYVPRVTSDNFKPPHFYILRWLMHLRNWWSQRL